MASEKNVVLAGYLIKSPPQEKLVAQWHRRYFVLLTSKIIEYYSSHERKPQDYLKSIDLSRCEDMIAPLPVTGRLHVIKLSVKIGNKLRDYFLDCSTEDNMNCWVTALAKTCGFCPVDDEDNQLEEEDLYASADIVHERTPPLPMQLPPPSHHIHGHERSPQPPPLAASLRNISPQPQPANNIKAWFSQDDMLTAVTTQDLDNNYHFLEQGSNCSSTIDRRDDGDFVQGYYDLGVDDETLYDMNKNPPPVWRPEDHRLSVPPPLPPNRPQGFSEIDVNTSKLQIRTPILPKEPPGRGRPLPPPKPQSELSGSATFSPRMNLPSPFNFKDDPRFTRKLEEKRQELYGGTNGVILRNRSISLNEVNDICQECYESISDVREVDKPTLRVTSLHNDYSEATDDPIGYLEFESSMSGNNSRAGSLPPDLPPKTDSMQRETSGLIQALPRKTAILPVPARTVHPAIRTDHTPPPPLPSRELINPVHEQVLPLKINQPPSTTDEEEEELPPVPVRISSNRSLPSLKDQPAIPRHSRSPDNRFTAAQDHLQANNFSQVLTDALNSNLNRKKASPSPRPRSSPVEEVKFEISSEIYDDIQPVRSPEEEEEGHLGMSYDDIVTSPIVTSPSPERKGNRRPVNEAEVARSSYNDVFNNDPENKVPVVANIAAISCDGQSTTETERALLLSLETKLHSRNIDSTNPALPPPVKPKTSPEKKPKPRRFQAPPTKPKPARNPQMPRVQQQLEPMIRSAPTSPKRVLSDPGMLDTEEFGRGTRAAVLPLKPKVHRKPIIPTKPGVADKPNVAIRPATNGRLPLKHKQTDSHSGIQDEPIKHNAMDKPVLKEKPKVAVQRLKQEDPREGQLRTVPSTSPSRVGTSSATASQPTAHRTTGPPPVGPRTGPVTAARNGPLPLPAVTARTSPLLPPNDNLSSPPNKGHSSATGRLGAVETASRTSPSAITSRTGPLPTVNRNGPPPTASRIGPPPVQPKPPKPDTPTSPQQPIGGAATEPWQRPPAPIPTMAKPPPVRPKPTQVNGKPPLQMPLCS